MLLTVDKEMASLGVLAFNVGERWCRYVSEDIAIEVLERAAAADDDLPEPTMAFIGRYAGFEKKPPVPSVSPRLNRDD
jgi:hypothetical protein